MENELLYNELYEKTQECGRAQFVRLLMEKERENQELKSKLKASEKARKEGVEFIKSNPNIFYDEYLIDVETVIKNEGKYDFIGEINFISKLLEILDIDKGE